MVFGYQESTPGCVCVWGAGVRKEALVMTPPSLSLDKMSTGGHLKQVIMTSYDASATNAYSQQCVFTGNAGSTAATVG